MSMEAIMVALVFMGMMGAMDKDAPVSAVLTAAGILVAFAVLVDVFGFLLGFAGWLVLMFLGLVCLAIKWNAEMRAFERNTALILKAVEEPKPVAPVKVRRYSQTFMPGSIGYKVGRVFGAINRRWHCIAE